MQEHTTQPVTNLNQMSSCNHGKEEELTRLLNLSKFDFQLKSQQLEEEQMRHNQSRNILTQMMEYQKTETGSALKQHEQDTKNIIEKLENKITSLQLNDTKVTADADEMQKRMKCLEIENKHLMEKISKLEAKCGEQLNNQIAMTRKEAEERDRLQDLVKTLTQQLFVERVQIVPGTPPVKTEQTYRKHKEKATSSMPDHLYPPIRQETSPTTSLKLDDFYMMESTEKNHDFYYKRPVLPPQVEDEDHIWRSVTEQIRSHSMDLLRPVSRRVGDANGAVVRQLSDGAVERIHPVDAMIDRQSEEMEPADHQGNGDDGVAVVPSTP